MAKAKTKSGGKKTAARPRKKTTSGRKSGGKKTSAAAADETRELKDRLLQTRITPSLYDQVVGRARELKIPVSNLIRIVLEDSVKLVDGVVDESLNIADILADRETKAPARPPAAPARPPAASAQAPAAAPPPPADEAPVAWQSVVVGRRAVCGDCGRDLYPAEPAQMGLGADGRPLLFACPDCYAKEIAAARAAAKK